MTDEKLLEIYGPMQLDCMEEWSKSDLIEFIQGHMPKEVFVEWAKALQEEDEFNENWDK